MQLIWLPNCNSSSWEVLTLNIRKEKWIRKMLMEQYRPWVLKLKRVQHKSVRLCCVYTEWFTEPAPLIFATLSLIIIITIIKSTSTCSPQPAVVVLHLLRQSSANIWSTASPSWWSNHSWLSSKIFVNIICDGRAQTPSFKCSHCWLWSLLLRAPNEHLAPCTTVSSSAKSTCTPLHDAQCW